MEQAGLPAVDRAFTLNCWLLEWVGKLPRTYKFTLGDRIQSTAIDLQLALVEAGHVKAKDRPLTRAARLLDQLRLLLRLAREVQVLSVRQHTYVSGLNDELGRMIGGWLRHARGTGGGAH